MMGKDMMYREPPTLKTKTKLAKNRSMFLKNHRTLIDVLIVLLLMATGVSFSDQVLLGLSTSAEDADARFVLPNFRRLVIGFITASMFIGGTDLVVGDAEGKLRVRARVVRYSAAVKSGVFFRMLQEAG